MSEAKAALKRIMGEEESCIILSGYVGSIAHGTHVPKTNPNSIDDKDVMGIMVLPKEYYIGLHSKEQTDVFVGEWDVVIYEIRKFFKLLLKNNPNVLGTLWLDENMYIHKSPMGDALIANRDIFLSKLAYQSFCGYAHSQLYKMEHNAFQGYMGDKRKQLVEKFGYDTKNAAHLIRLLRMGIELLTECTLHVFRHDAEELKEIKQGQWKIEEVKDEAKRLFLVMEDAYLRTRLPDKPDHAKAEDLMMGIIQDTWRTRAFEKIADYSDIVC